MSITHEEFYKASNLIENPFRANPVMDADPRMGLWVGYDKEKQTFLKYLSRTRSDQVGNNNFFMIYGYLGTGKTHALLWARRHILKDANQEFLSVAYYVPTLKKSKGQISFAAAFREDIVANSTLAHDVLVFRQFLNLRLVEFRNDNNLNAEVSTEVVVEKVLQSSELFNFAKEILMCDNEMAVKDLLTPNSDYEAMMMFSKLVKLFVFEFKLKTGKSRFKRAVYLFIDELDILAFCTAKEAREVNDLFRHLYDNCPSCFCLVLGLTATAAEIPSLFSDYVLSRTIKPIVLDFLQPDDALSFVQAILDLARLDKSKKSKMGCFPFAEDAVNTIVSQIVSITPRKIVNDMQQILEESRLADLNPASGQITTKMLEENGILADVQGRS